MVVILMFLLMVGNGRGLLESATAGDSIISHYGEKPMPRQTKTDCGGSTDKPTPPDNKRDLVITPAGPIPKEEVHLVKPGEIVRRNEDGTYTIIPNPDL